MKLATTSIFKKLYKENNNLICLNDSELKLLQKTILSIADDIISLCEKNNINYHLTGGSALGAVRHNGFISWDDDLDLDVARKDYDRLITLIRQNYSHKYYIHNPYNVNHPIPATKIRLKNTVVRGCTDSSNEECGAYIDIAIIENVFDNLVLRYLHGFISLLLGLIVSCRKFYSDRNYLLNLSSNKKIRKIFKIKICIGSIFSFLSLKKWTVMYDKWNSLCKNEKTKFVSVPTGRKHYFGELYLRKDFYVQTKHIFEGRQWNIPINFNKYLSLMYDDYMIIPDEENREKHVLKEFKID